MEKRYHILDYPEYSGCVLTGLRIAAKIMPWTFWSTTQSKNAQSTEGAQKENQKGEQSTNAKLETNSVLGIRTKRLEK